MQIKFEGGPIDGQTVEVSRLDNRFWFKNTMYVNYKKNLYLPQEEYEKRQRYDTKHHRAINDGNPTTE